MLDYAKVMSTEINPQCRSDSVLAATITITSYHEYCFDLCHHISIQNLALRLLEHLSFCCTTHFYPRAEIICTIDTVCTLYRTITDTTTMTDATATLDTAATMGTPSTVYAPTTALDPHLARLKFANENSKVYIGSFGDLPDHNDKKTPAPMFSRVPPPFLSATEVVRYAKCYEGRLPFPSPECPAKSKKITNSVSLVLLDGLNPSQKQYQHARSHRDKYVHQKFSST